MSAIERASGGSCARRMALRGWSIAPALLLAAVAAAGLASGCRAHTVLGSVVPDGSADRPPPDPAQDARFAGDINGRDVHADVRPDLRPDLAPDVPPDLAPDVPPDLAPDVPPDQRLGPDVRMRCVQQHPPAVHLQPGSGGQDAVISSAGVPFRPTRADVPLMLAEAWTWSGSPGVHRTLMKFELPDVPSQEIGSVTLTLHGDPDSPVPPASDASRGHQGLDMAKNDGWLLRVLEPWDEDQVTWATQPRTYPVPSPFAWSTAGAVYLPESSWPKQTYVVDVTDMVKPMLTGSFPNHGFLLRLADEEHYRRLSFCSSDHPEPTLHPTLVITFKSPPGCAEDP